MMNTQIVSTPSTPARPKVLVVDDDMAMRRAMELILAKEFDVTTLESGLKAVEAIGAGAVFEVVSLDIRMPGMSGIEALQAIKNICPDTEVLMVTGTADVETAKSALKAGAFDYIDKPVNKDAYREAIRRGVARREKSRAASSAQQQVQGLKAQLIHAQKLQSIGQMLAGVMHEINNPLSVVMGYVDLMISTPLPPEKQQEFLKKIRQGAELCISVAQKVLNLSRRKEPKTASVDINDIIGVLLDLKAADMRRHRITVNRQFAGDLPSLTADVNRLEQVFLNLINNAQQAMAEWEGERLLTVTTLVAADGLRIHFKDSGPGIEPANIQKIFEPFFTTKEIGKGTGLGLSICYDIIQDHGGRIYLASEPGKGADFIIELPLPFTF